MTNQIDIMSAIRQIASERKIDVDTILTSIKAAIRASFENEYGLENLDVLNVEIDPVQGHIAVFADKRVVKKVSNPLIEIALTDAKKIDAGLKEGDSVLIDVTPKGDFGRIAAQTSRQIILQKLREAEKDAALAEVEDKMGTIEHVEIQRFTRDGLVIADLGKARAVMPQEEQIPTEFYKIGNRIKVLLVSIENDERGDYVLISRAAPEFLKELFRMEVPEIDSGTVEIVSIAREEGSRSKVAVKSNASGVDPIGSCVGQKGIRINAISNELKSSNGIEEKVDIIMWDEDIQSFLKNAIRPAEALEVILVDTVKREAIIVVPDDQLSLAIGKDGQNVRLSAKLTGWKLDIQSLSERQENKNAESETGKEKKEKKSKKGAEDELSAAGLSTRTVKALNAAGISSLDQLKEIEDVSSIAGIGPKSKEELEALLK